MLKRCQIPLSELRVEKHHRGQGIIVRIASPPFVGAGAVSVVEDEFGNADKLAIYNQGDTSILSGVPEGCVVAVKEPYYKFNGAEGDYMICVDHPSDVILLRFTDPIIPEKLRLGPLLKTAEDWKKAGDTAFLEKDFPTAVFCYTEALEESKDEEGEAFRASIHTKRAGTNLLLGRYDAAKADALASRTGTPADWKAYYNAGRAAYGLCDYKTSRSHLEQSLALKANGSGVRKELDRCLARLREEEHGDYDFRAMYESLNKDNVHLDRGSFLRRTFVATSPHHGRGLFAAEDISAGELLFVEKATLMPNQYEPARASAALYAMMVRQLCDNPSLADTVLQMHPGDYPRSGLEGTIVDGAPVVDIFLVEGIRTKNCFSLPLSTLDDTKLANPEGKQAKGLWTHAANMNHSCVANSMRSFLGDMLISRATRNIKKGEELFQQYVPVKSVPDARNAQYTEAWGFACNCALCAGERRSSPALLAKRKDLVAQLEKLLNKKQQPKKGTVIPDASIRQIDRLHKQLEDLHEAAIYEPPSLLPRLMLIYPCNWLLGAHRGRKNWGKVIRYGLRVLRNFGFAAVPLVEGDVTATTTAAAAAAAATGTGTGTGTGTTAGGEETEKEKENNDALLLERWDPRGIYTASGETSLMTIHVIATLRRLAEAFEMTGGKELAERCREAAGFGYKMVTGFENDMTGMDRD